jgi:hypothetical protein
MTAARMLVGAAVVASLAACSTQSSGTASATGVDHSDPAAVVSAIFSAAKARDSRGLSGLCDPQRENDSDTQEICELHPDAPKWKVFVAAFENGAVAGRPRVADNRAEVDFTYVDTSETMRLVLRDGKWYLSGF